MISELVNLLILVGFGITVLVGMGIAVQLMQQRDAGKREKGARENEYRDP